MNTKAYQHIREIMNDKFGPYYEFLNKNMIKSGIVTLVYKKFGNDGIINGEADEYFIQLVGEFLRDKYVEDLEKTIELKNHIRMVVTHKESILSLDKQSQMLDYVIDKIAVELASFKEYSVNLDEEIMKSFNQYLEVLNNELSQYVDDLLHFSFVKINNNSNNTYNYLKKDLIKKFLAEKSIDLILAGNFDEEIIRKYEDIVSKNREKVKKYIQKFIRNLDFPYNISEKLIIADVNKKIFETGEFDLNNLYSGKLNSYIMKHGEELKKQQTRVDALNHVYNLISQNANGNHSKDELVEYSEETVNILTEKYNCTLLSIYRGSHNDLILKIYNRLVMKKNSVVDEKKPKKIKHKTTKKIMTPLLKWLLLITMLIAVTASTISIYNAVDYGIASSKVSDFDGYTYSSIYAVDNNRVEPTGDNAYYFYKKVVSAGFNEEQYGYLSFYKAYTLVHQDRLYIMDEVMKKAMWEAKKYDDQISKDFYQELSSCSCFLDFAIRRLEYMGCKEASKMKYRDALKEYEGAIEYGVIPMNKISLEARETIDEVMALYRKYSKDRINDFGDLLEYSSETSDNMILYNDSHSRRNV